MFSLDEARRAGTQIGIDWTAAPFDVSLLERRQATPPILTHRLDERQADAALGRPAKLHAVCVLAPSRHVRHQIDAEDAATLEDAGDRRQRPGEIAIAQE